MFTRVVLFTLFIAALTGCNVPKEQMDAAELANQATEADYEFVARTAEDMQASADRAQAAAEAADAAEQASDATETYRQPVGEIYDNSSFDSTRAWQNATPTTYSSSFDNKDQQ